MYINDGALRVWAEINLDCLRHNLEQARSRVKPGTRIMAVVKADAYGHGAVETARNLALFGVDALAVAQVEEGIELRSHQIDLPILILGKSECHQAAAIAEYRLTPSLWDTELAERISREGRERGVCVKAHVRVDTGMGNYGAMTGSCVDLIRSLRTMNHLEIEGIYTHINAIYGGSPDDAGRQAQVFQQLQQELEAYGLLPPLVHVASSPVFLKVPASECNLVRLGIMLYGLPCRNERVDHLIRPVMQLKSRVENLKEVDSGFRGGYGWDFTAPRASLLATVPVGYADAFYLHYMHGGQVLINGHSAPIVGKVCMDHLMVDVTDITGVQVGDEVVIIGEQGGETISAEEIARKAGISPDNCDMVCLLQQRVPRIYVHDE